MKHKALKGKVICTVCKQEVPYSSWQTHTHDEFLLFGVQLSYFVIKIDNLNIKNSNKTNSMWDFDSALPISYKDAISLGEGKTPLHQLINYGHFLGIKNLYLKDESKNPTGSFKDRGSTLMVSHAKILGKKKIAIPSCGNAAISIVEYAKKANIVPTVFIPKDISQQKLNKLKKEKVKIKAIDGTIKDVYYAFLDYIKNNPEVYDAFPVNNPFYFQGLKTTAYEIFIQLNDVPDWIIIPCGGGNYLYSLYLGFSELKDLKIIKKLPRFVCVQIKGADPISKGVSIKKFSEIQYIKNPISSIAEGIVATTSFNYHNVMKALIESKGDAISITDDQIKMTYLDFIHIENELILKEQLLFEPTSCSVFAALDQLKEKIGPNKTVVVIATGCWKKGEDPVGWVNK